MLSVMAYNIYIIIAIVIGYALGYFVFGQTAIKIKLKNCQVKRDTFCMSDCGDPGKIYNRFYECIFDTQTNKFFDKKLKNVCLKF